MAFVIVSHRAAENADLLTKIISSCTHMPVIDVADGMRVVPNHVFIAPPLADLTLEGEFFRLTVLSHVRGWPTNISTFLQSLAENSGSRTIAVILSGKGYDGSSAMSAVSAAGGINMAQANATSPEMPAAAVNTGYVDFYLTSAEIAEQLLEVAR